MAPSPKPNPEHVVLEFEVQHLRDELRSYDQELPCWTAEACRHTGHRRSAKITNSHQNMDFFQAGIKVKAAESFAESLENELKQDYLDALPLKWL